MVSIITPWHNAPELIPIYERCNAGAQVVIIDNASTEANASLLLLMAERMGGLYIRNETNRLFAHANNQGLEVATGDVIVFLNNDTEAPPGWVDRVAEDVTGEALYGPSLKERDIAGRLVPYIEGWCIAARRETWDMLGGWPTTLPGLYWEDNILCFGARELGIELAQTRWPVWHYNNYTSAKVAGSYDHSEANAKAFAQIVTEAA